VFVGRQGELAVVRAAFARAVAGEGSFVALVGEPGIGKTRTAAELARGAQAHGALAVWGRCHAGDVAPAFWPWAQVLRSYAQDHPNADVEALASALREAPQTDLTPPPMTVPSGLVRFEMFERVVTLLRGVARRQPLLLLFDDLHWADRSSLLLLEFAARELRDAAVLFIGTYRDTELAHRPDVAELLGNLTRLGTTLQLGGLGRGDMGTLVQQSFAGTLSDAVVAAVHEATDGNPFFALEVVSLLSSDEVLAARTARGAAALPIPVGVRETIRRRLAPLSTVSRQILRAAAVLGREFDLMPLGPMLTMPSDRVLEALHPAFAAGLVRLAPEGLRRYAFAHALVREQLYDEIPIPERATWHRQAGEAIEAMAMDTLEEHAAELAHHFFEAARSGDPEKAVSYGRRAGMRALALCAYDEAMRAFERALEAADLAPSTSGDMRVELLVGLADARHGEGDREGAKTASRDAVGLARTCGPSRFAEAVVHYVEVHREAIAVDEGMLALLEEALAALPPDADRLQALLRTQLAASMWLRLGLEHRQRKLADEAMGIARRLGHTPTLIYVLAHRLLALLGPDTLPERLAAENEVIQLAERLGERSAAVSAFTLRIHDLLELGDRRGLTQAIQECEQHAATRRHAVYRWQASSVRTMVALLEGRWAEAEALSNETLAVGQTVQAQAALIYFVAQLLKLRAETGRIVEVAPLVEMAVAPVPARHGVLADVYAVLGRTDDARRELDALAADDFGGVPRDAAWLTAMCLAANACVQLADRQRAAVLYAMLRPYRDRIATVPPAIVALSPVAHHLGQLAIVLECFDDAAEHLDHALVIAERMQSSPWVAHAEQAYAELLVVRRGAGDRRRALRRLERAQRIGEELGMALVLARVAATRARAETLPPDQDEPAAEATGEAIESVELVEIPLAVGDTRPGVRERAAAGPRGKIVQLVPRAAGSDRERSSFRRAGDIWTISHAGRTIRLRHGVGLGHIALLLEHPRQPFHVNDLLAQARQAGRAGGDLPAAAAADLPVRADLGDAGEILDSEAKAAYRQRLAELREELEGAIACNDLGRTERAQAEIEFVRGELERSMGLGGRDRRAAAATERARVAVAKAIKYALGKIAEQDVALAGHLERAVRTGYFCAYEPAAGDSPVWDV
jgi:tetratricopeptide (TPR) repeat protein